MNDYSTKGALELEVADFGPIVEAKIDLRPLTVFIGPSNTGKSYLAIPGHPISGPIGSSRTAKRNCSRQQRMLSLGGRN